MIIDRKSWHFKLIRNFDNYYMPTNFCAYWGKLLGILFFYLSVAVGVGLLGAALWVYTKTTLLAIGIILGFVATFVMVCMVFTAIFNLGKSDSLLAAKYKSWKEKICVPIEYR